MTRHPVPGTEHYFDLRDLSELNTDHQQEYRALVSELRAARQESARAELIAAHPGMIPDPEQEIPVRLTPGDLNQLRDLLLSWILEGSSFGIPLTWPLPLIAGNVLEKGLSPYYSAISGEVPEDPTPAASSSTSASTSGAAAAAPQPEQQTEPSATPAG